MDTPFLRSGYNYDRDLASRESGLECKDETLTQQHMAAEADINTIVKRFGLTGQLPEDVRAPISADFLEVFDYQTAMNSIRAADESFAAMPAEVRTRFRNDPGVFVDFCTEVDARGTLVNLDEMRKLGLATPKVDPPIVPPVPAA